MGECIEREAVLRAVQRQRSPCRSPAQNQMLDCLKAPAGRAVRTGPNHHGGAEKAEHVDLEVHNGA